jgi:hypothetical protein
MKQAVKEPPKPVKTPSPQSRSTKEKAQIDFAFGRINYSLMFAGMGLMLFGYILMSGGGSDDPNVFNPEVFSHRRITVAPILVLSGLVVLVFSIIKKAKD